MKKALQNKYVIALVIIAAAGTVMYFTTWGNKNWLIEQIGAKGGAEDKVNLQKMSVSGLRTKLKSLS